MAENDPAEKPLWTPAFRDLIPDQYVVQEFDRLAAYLRTLGNPQTIIQAERQIEKSDPPDPKKDNPDVTVKPDEGVRWLKGPHVLNADNDTALAKGSAAFSVSVSGGTYNDWGPDGIDSAIMVLIKPYSSAVSLTGIKRKARQTRILTLINYGSSDLKLINQSAGSNAVHRFSWGTSGDAGETLTIPTGMGVTLIYNTQNLRWMLSAVPPVGRDNLPPSMITPPNPFDFHWFAGAMIVNSAGAGARGVFEDQPAITNGASITANSTGIGVTCTTNAIIGDVAGVGANATPPRVVGAFDPIWTTIMGTGGSLADTRIWIVLSSNAPSNSDDYGGNIVGFRYSSVAGDPGWVGVTRDGATQTVTGLVAAIATGTTYKLKVRWAGSTVYFSVNGGTEVSATATLPSTGTGLVWYCHVFTNAAAAKSLTWYRHHLRGLSEP